VNCQFGRDNFESWGRRRRSVGKRDTQQTEDEEDEDDEIAEVVEEDSHMRLSHEIIVLDYGDERSSPYDNEKRIERQKESGNSK